MGSHISMTAPATPSYTDTNNSIDTPGVIDRVSTLFRGHPSLIQGFNTFLPPGYRIDCLHAEGDSQGLITVTTPMGTISQVAGRFAAALETKEKDLREAAAKEEAAANARKSPGNHGGTPTGSRDPAPTPKPAPSTTTPSSNRTPAPSSQPAPAPTPVAAPPAQQAPTSGPSTPNMAPFVPTAAQIAIAASRVPMVEFNHAISFVNKIKNRFNNDPDTYKQFLEILQTYQRDTRDIAEVSCRCKGDD